MGLQRTLACKQGEEEKKRTSGHWEAVYGAHREHIILGRGGLSGFQMTVETREAQVEYKAGVMPRVCEGMETWMQDYVYITAKYTL